MGMLANLVRESSTNPGTGDFTLNGSPVGYVPFVQAFGTGASCFYVARSADLTLTEIGRGTVTGGTPNTLSRDMVIWNSQVLAKNPTKLSFTGTLDVYCDGPAERTPTLADDGSLTLTVAGGAPSLVKRAADFTPIFATAAGSGGLTTSDANQLSVPFTATGTNLFMFGNASLLNNDTMGNGQSVAATLRCQSGAGATAGQAVTTTGFIGGGGQQQTCQVTCNHALSGLTIGAAYSISLLLRKAGTNGAVSASTVQIGGFNF